MKLVKNSLIFFAASLILLEAALRLTGVVYSHSLIENNAKSKPDGINILCLGESSTAGLWVAWESSYPKQLEKLLREHYQRDNINVIVPVHIGQNSSQMANRIEHYLAKYKPELVIMMVGANNEWSLSETHAVRFFENYTKKTAAFHLTVLLDDLRVYKLARYAFIRLFRNRDMDYFIAPVYGRWPPKPWIYAASRYNPEAFRKMWNYDVRVIYEAARKHDVKVILMSYAMPVYISEDTMEKIAADLQVPFIRNETAFKELHTKGILKTHLMQDLWHPSAEGYTVIAKNVFDEITKSDLLNLGQIFNPVSGVAA